MGTGRPTEKSEKTFKLGFIWDWGLGAWDTHLHVSMSYSVV